MDFDPGMFTDDDMQDSYEEGYEDAEATHSDLVETDELGNPVLLAAAAGFGYHMAQDGLEEREIAEEILKKREGKPEKIPLAKRHETKGYMTPFARWATKVNINPAKSGDAIEYTKEEQLQIIKEQGEGHEE